MAVPKEKIAQLKQEIHAYLSEVNIDDKLKKMLAESVDDDDAQNGDEDLEADEMKAATRIRDILRRQGLVTSIVEELKTLKGTKGTQKSLSDIRPSLAQAIIKENEGEDVKQKCLYLRVIRGKAFINHLNDQDTLPGQPTSYFRLYIKFKEQRYRSQLVSCCCEPEFDEGFLLEFPKASGDLIENFNVNELLSVSSPIHLALVRVDQLGYTSLVSSYFLEWRSVLASYGSRTRLAIELFGVGTENQVVVGILEINLELLPPSNDILSPEDVATQLNLERSRRTEQERLFLIYAKQWWKEYLQIRSSHEFRYVKIFAQDENGSTHPVCQYINPMQVGRLLETPQEAAWFVALIPHGTLSTVGGGGNVEKSERWAHLHSVLCVNKGTCEEHAVLLCSLLLGFGLDAYVCIGTKAKDEPYAWVVTLGYIGHVVFWDPITATRHEHVPIKPNDAPIIPQPIPTYPFVRIGCVFNHKNFFANSQHSDSAFTCHFDFTKGSHWKSMDADNLLAVNGTRSWVTVRPPPLISNSLDPFTASEELEEQLKFLVTEFRRDLCLSTVWDPQLSYLLGPALASYELEKKIGLNISNEDFNLAIRRAVPTGQTFKGFPVRFNHIQARRIFSSCLKSDLCDDILRCRGDIVRHAIRARVFVYPESVVSVWVMISVKYKCVL